jgi:hypothetical protein
MDDPIIRRSRDIRLSTDGSVLFLRVWPGLPPEEARPLVTNGDVLRWLEKGLPRTDACVCGLLEALNIMVTTVPVSQAISPFDPAEQACDAMQTLKARLPFLIQRTTKQHLADALRHLLSAVESANSLIDVPVPKDHKALPWHDDAIWLVYILQNAAPELKISSAGPGVRFIQNALKHVWGKQLTGDQIRKAVARYDHGRIPDLMISG